MSELLLLCDHSMRIEKPPILSRLETCSYFGRFIGGFVANLHKRIKKKKIETELQQKKSKRILT